MRQHRPRMCASFPVSHAYTAYSCDVIFISVSRCPAILRCGTTISRTPWVAASDSHTQCSHIHVPRPASHPCKPSRATCPPTTRVPAGGDISTNITRGSPHPAHGGARPRAPFTSVKPNIYACNRLRCGSIDLVRPHLSQYRTHIQHTRAM